MLKWNITRIFSARKNPEQNIICTNKCKNMLLQTKLYTILRRKHIYKSNNKSNATKNFDFNDKMCGNFVP